MEKVNIPSFKHTRAYIFLVTLANFFICTVSLLITVIALSTDTRLSKIGISKYHLVITLGLIGYIVEIFLNKRRKIKEDALLSNMTEEECKKHKKESSECFRIFWWHEPICYTICAFLIEVILALFN